MNDSDRLRMVEVFRNAWPDDALSDDDAGEVAKLFSAYDTTTVSEAIADRLEAELPRPERAELSRVLRFYAPNAKSDPRPEPAPAIPSRPWISSLSDPPPVSGVISERVDELRQRVREGAKAQENRPRSEPTEPERGRVVPLFVWEALERGRVMFAENRRARLDGAK